MNTNFKTTLIVSIVLSLGFLLVSFMAPQAKENKPWEIPAKYKKMVNPTPGEDVKIGKSIYAKHCKSCHGNKGLGDGPKAKSLDTDCGDFSSEKFQAQKDGELYYQSFVGRDEMPNYEKKILDEEDRWAVINYLRSLKK